MSLQQYLRVLTKTQTRQLLVISGEKDWCYQQAKTCLQANFPTGVWLDSQQAQQPHLGQEYSAIVYDAFLGFNPDQVALLTGCVAAGGLFILVCPPLAQWPQYDCPDYARFLSTQTQAPTLKRYLARLATAIAQDPNILLWQQGHAPHFVHEKLTQPNTQRPLKQTSECQRHAIDLIERVALGHRNRPLVLTADRGRGKSAALGLACESIATQHDKQIIITGPNKKNCQVALDFAKGHARFHTVPELLTNKPRTDLLLVDEAAAIPNHLLTALLKQFKRVVFASTLHGYEGSGRGFELRFFAKLDELAPDWKHAVLHTPIRWQTPCALEDWVDSTFSLKAELATVADTTVCAQDCVYEYLTIEQLEKNQEVAQVFALLCQAHYQTKPSHLRFLLDTPGLVLFVARHRNVIVGICECIPEGNLAPDLSQAICAGRRRAHGHLVAQQLAYSHKIASLCEQTSMRIHRITVHPQLQARGIGTRLVQFACANLTADFLSTSFGATAPLLNFWQRCGFQLIQLGTKPETTTGEFSAICLAPGPNIPTGLYQNMQAHFLQRLQYWLPGIFQALSPELVQTCLRLLPSTQPLSAWDKQQVQTFISGETGLELARPSLHHFAYHAIANEQLNKQATDILIYWLLQARTAAAAAQPFGCSGLKDLSETLRQALIQA